ncbi:MAG TPA: ABC transporter permease [Thermoanaerobaculia bacterium]|nr:ABC transporter permease [Thermoanaerobaculia bacterium]
MDVPILARCGSWWRNLAHRARVEGDLADDVASYLELLAEEKMRAGMSPQAARRAARVELGGVEQVKERVRAVRTGAWLDTLALDLRYGVRMLVRSPGFTAVALLALALGIGANTAIFSVVDGVLLRALPYPDAGRLMLVSRHFSGSNFPFGNLCLADYVDWRAANRAFEAPAVFQRRRFDLTGTSAPEQVGGAAVSAGFFSALRVRPLLGRVFRAGEDGPARERLAVVSESLWRRRFGGSPGVVGQAVDLDGNRATVVGVLPSSFHFPRPDSEVWTNLVFAPPTRRGPFFYRGLARLKPGVTPAQAQAELAAIARRIELGDRWTARLSFPMQPLREAIVGDARPALLVLLGAVSLVLLIAAVNVANLLLARATARDREMAVRLGLGAGRARLLRQLLTESALLALAGGAAGVAVAAAGIALLRAWNPGNLPRIEEVHLDARVLGFTLVISLAAGVLFGLAPALHSSRTDLAAALKAGGRGSSASAGRRRARAVLVVAEIALSLLLLAGASLLLRSFVRLQRVETGMLAPPARVLSVQISPSAAKYRDDKTSIAFYQQLLERVRRLPGVEAAAVADSLPPDREGNADTYVIAGRPLGPGELNPVTSAPTVDADYFRTLGIPLLAGRCFDRRDRQGSPPVAIISEGMARRDFAGRDPIGQRLKASGPELNDSPYLEIVGVVGNTKYLGLASPLDAAYYQAAAQNGGQKQFLVLRSAVPAAGLAPLVRREVQAIDRDVVAGGAATMEQALAESVAPPRFRTLLLAAFAAVAVLLAAIGIYGVIAYAVVQRTHEIGLRMALGAGRAEVLRLVVGQGAYLALAGIGLGLAGALAGTRVLAKLLFGVGVTDPLTFILVPVLLAAVALAASFIPARRAALIDPQKALQYD